MTAIELFLAFVVQMMVIVDPLAGVPVFLGITPNNDHRERRRLAGRGCLVALGIIVFFLLVGARLLEYFGIQLAAVRICGGVLLFVISLEMLYGRSTGTGASRRERLLAGTKPDISITPLAFPLLAGPGAIATALLFAGQAQSLTGVVALLTGAVVVFAATWLLLCRAEVLTRWMGEFGSAVVTRIMGLILAFVAVQYAIDGVRAVMAGTP